LRAITSRPLTGEIGDHILGYPVGEIFLLGSPLMFWNANTAIEGLSGDANAGADGCVTLPRAEFDDRRAPAARCSSGSAGRDR
jgi:hypothetical protein